MTSNVSHVELHEISSSHLPEAVPYAVITPPGYRESPPLPLCIVLMGGGGSRQSLVDCQPLFDGWWAEGSLPPMVFATPSPGMSYYVDDPDAGLHWGAFLSGDFLDRLRATCHVSAERSDTALTGISMGGYGALKTAFAHSDRFGVVAALQPMLEPGFHDAEIGARNRLHHLSGGPANLIGAGRDPALFEANNPVNRALANAAALRDSGLAIYLDAADGDFVNAHDGAEFLHRVLWELDLSHEYRLVRGADHGGPTLAPRMRDAFVWAAAAMTPAPARDPFLTTVRAQFAPLRELAAATDPTTNRRFGRLPDTLAVTSTGFSTART